VVDVKGVGHCGFHVVSYLGGISVDDYHIIPLNISRINQLPRSLSPTNWGVETIQQSQKYSDT
jgi:hypothetical protein